MAEIAINVDSLSIGLLGVFAAIKFSISYIKNKYFTKKEE